MKEDPVVLARAAMKELWKKAQCHGRCWGRKTKENKFQGSNITLIHGAEVVTVNQIDGKLVVHEFTKTAETELGIAVFMVLKAAGLEVRL